MLHRLCSRSAVLLPLILNHPARTHGNNNSQEVQAAPNLRIFFFWSPTRGLHVLQLAYPAYFWVLGIASAGSLILPFLMLRRLARGWFGQQASVP